MHAIQESLPEEADRLLQLHTINLGSDLRRIFNSMSDGETATPSSKEQASSAMPIILSGEPIQARTPGFSLPRQLNSGGNMRTNRRHFLDAAALGAGGLIAFEKIAEAAALQHDHGNPGDGGYGRRVDRLPPGPAVAYHDPKDVAAMPDFRYSLDGNNPKVTSGGWAKEATVHHSR